MPRIHPIFGIIAVPLLAALLLLLEYSAQTRHQSQLIGDLKSADSTVQQSAVEALGKTGEPMIEPLIAALKDPDPQVEQGAAEALGKIGEPAVKPLIAALEDSDIRIQRSAVEQALARIGQPAVHPLIAELDSVVAANQQSAAEALGRIGQPAVDALIDHLSTDNVESRQGAIKALRVIGEPAVQPLVAKLADNPYSGLRQALSQALDAIGKPAVKPTVDRLIAVLRNQGLSWNERQNAAVLLGAINDPSAIAPLTASAHADPDPDVRASALAALRTIKSSGQSSPASTRDTAGSSPAASHDKDKRLALHLARAKALWSAGSSEEALGECDAALSLDPGNAEASALREKYARAIAILNGTSQ